MVSLRARALAAPIAAALFLTRKAGAAPVASPTPWSSWPAGFTFQRLAASTEFDLSHGSKLALFRFTYEPGVAWEFAFPYRVLALVESGSLTLRPGADRVMVGRPVAVSGKNGSPSRGTGYFPAAGPTTLFVGDTLSLQTGNVGLTSNDGDAPVHVLVAGAVVQPPLTEEVTSERGTPVSTP